jgi:hypothetical protein
MAAAHWLFNGREPRPFASYELHWKGRQESYPRRMVHGHRPTTEQTVFDDVAAILRETPATEIKLVGVLHKGGHSRKTIVLWLRSHSWVGSELRWGAITGHGDARYLTQSVPQQALDSESPVTHDASVKATPRKTLAECTRKALQHLSDAIDALDEAHEVSEPGTDLGNTLECAAQDARIIWRGLDRKARAL